jgi:FkbM family methyltransferase
MNRADEPADALRPRIYEHDFVAMRKCKHGTFLYNVHDLFVSRSMDCYGEWCEAELDVLGQVIRPGDVVLDVGANIGTHAVFFAQRVTERGCVFAFEPQRLVFQTLCANVALNALVNVITRQQAVGKRAETIRLPVFDPRRDMNFGAICAAGHADGEPVQAIRVDDLRLGRCDLIKVDVEGMECDVLEGARETIARHRPVLFVENNTIEGSQAIISLIDSLEYDAYWHIRSCYNVDNYDRNRENIFATFQPEANLICFHRSRAVDIHGFQKVAGPHDTWRRVLDGMLASSTNEE